MVQKLKAVFGRIELRILFLLACGIVLISLAATFAQVAKTPAPIDNGQTVATWDDLIKQYTAFREKSYMLAVPSWYLDQDQVEEIFNTYSFAGFQGQPDWYWNFDGGVFLYEDKSPLAQLVKHGTQVVLYEDMANQELLIVDANSGQEEIVYKSPAWPTVGPTENYSAYLSRELSKRRLVWKVTLKNSTLAAQEDQQAALAASKTKSLGGGGVGMDLMMGGGGSPTQVCIVEMWQQTNGVRMEIGYPGSYSGMVWSAYSYDAPACLVPTGTGGGGNPNPPDTNDCTNCGSGFCNIDPTNTFQGLAGNPWTLVCSNLVLTGATQTAWIDTRPLAFDANTNPVNRFYTLGANAVDSDTDNLSDAYELLTSKTSPSNPDTDGDGASDGDEVAHGTNPLNNPGDTDGDGLSDDLETVLGTDPGAADSDQDWASDGYEVQQGFNPLNATSTPTLMMKINGGALYSASTNLVLTFPGLVATQVILAESSDFTDSQTNSFSNTMTYALSTSSNGWRSVYAQLLRNGYEESPMLSSVIILDTLSPNAAITSPTNGTVTSRAWLRVEGTATDSVSAVKVLINGEWADGIETGTFWQTKLNLQPGTNAILVTVQDEAGNEAIQAVSVVQSFTGDTTAPIVSLNLPQDYQITGGTTNWFTTTTFGDSDTLYVGGTIDDDAGSVTFTVTSAGQTNGPFNGDVVGTQIWGNVTLFPGTNLLTVTGSDAAGNSYSTNYTVIRDTNFFLAITNPAAYQVMNSPSTTVSGIASPQFSNATITVNGISATISNQGSNVTFTTITPVPLSSGLTMLLATAELNGRSYYADPPPYGYEILEWNQTWKDGGHWHFVYNDPSYYYLDVKEVDAYTYHWDAQSTTWSEFFEQPSTWCTYPPLTCYDSPYTYSDNSSMATSPASGYFGKITYNDRAVGGYPCSADDTQDTDLGGNVRFRKHWPTQETQTVVFQFAGFDIGRASGHDIDPSTITYRNQTGFWYNGNMSFIVPITIDAEYSITEKDFTWPEYDYSYAWLYNCGGTMHEKGHWLSWDSFSNGEVTVTNESDKATNSPIGFKTGKTDPASPCGKELKDAEALVVYYSDVFDYTNLVVQDFDVMLKITPTNIPEGSWTKVSGPDSGQLSNSDQRVATYRNPKMGGVYQFEATVGDTVTRTQLWLPTAGPDISYYWESEIDYFRNTWGPAYRTKLDNVTSALAPLPLIRAIQKHRIALREIQEVEINGVPMEVGNNLDWTGQVLGTLTPCGGPSYSSGDEWRQTLYGVVIDFRKRNNMMYALIGREMTLLEVELRHGPDYVHAGTPDGPPAFAAYEAGFDLFDGTSLQAVMQNHGYDMQEPGSWAQKEWPSDESSQGGLTRKAAAQLEAMIQ